MIFKDKHVVIAMFVAPILAVIAWYGVDQLVAEDPHAAIAGAAYSLIAKSNCRYASGACDLENGEFKIELTAEGSDSEKTTIALQTKILLQAVQIGLVSDGVESAPVSMKRVDAQGLVWNAELESPSSGAEMRVVAKANDATWYAQVPTVFLLDGH